MFPLSPWERGKGGEDKNLRAHHLTPAFGHPSPGGRGVYVSRSSMIINNLFRFLKYGRKSD
jgi:hypothetical protein